MLSLKQKKIFRKVVSLNSEIQAYIHESVLGSKYIKATNKISFLEDNLFMANPPVFSWLLVNNVFIQKALNIKTACRSIISPVGGFYRCC